MPNKNTSATISEIQTIWNEKDETVRALLNKYSDLPVVLTAMFTSVRMTINAALAIDLTREQCALLQLWRNLYKYQEDSLFLIMSQRLDAGFALLRMATELARDIARMNEDVVNYEMWHKKHKLNQEEFYKKTFRFNRKDPLEKLAYGFYNLFSNWGVHGHLTGIAHMEKAGTTGDGDYVILAIPEDAIIRSIGLWMAAFLPLNKICQNVFSNSINSHSSEPIHFIDDMMVASSEVINLTRKYGRQTKKPLDL